MFLSHLKKIRPNLLPIIILSVCLLVTNSANSGEWSGYIAAEYRNFPHDALDSRQYDNNISFIIEPEYHHKIDGSYESITFTPFIHIDQHDNERTHFDIRELMWQKAAKDWELRAGIGKVFWGVTESQHLVDVINQTDLVEGPDGEDKLGQPMINLALVRDWGTIDFFLLPGFRERTFPEQEGRLRTSLRVDTEQAVYESSRGKRHVDAAIRWSHNIGILDIGLSHFYGTSRDPRLVVGTDSNGSAVLVPYYDIVHQTGLDMQVTSDSWLLKLETIHRSGQGETFNAVTAGLEYTFYGLGSSSKDLGMLFEYSYDDRRQNSPALFQDDVMAGVRLVFNDVNNTEALFGVIYDRHYGSKGLTLEASRRFGDSIKVSVEARTWHETHASDPLNQFRHDDYFQAELAWYY